MIQLCLKGYSIEPDRLPYFCIEVTSKDKQNFKSGVYFEEMVKVDSISSIHEYDLMDGSTITRKIFTIENYKSITRNKGKVNEVKLVVEDDQKNEEDLQIVLKELINREKLRELYENRVYQSFIGLNNENQCFYNKNQITIDVEKFYGTLEELIIAEQTEQIVVYVPYKIYLTMQLVRTVIRLHNNNFVHLRINPAAVSFRDNYLLVLDNYKFSSRIGEVTKNNPNPFLIDERYFKEADKEQGEKEEVVANSKAQASESDGEKDFKERDLIAPKVTPGVYTRYSDIYSLGVTIFYLWIGKPDEKLYNSDDENGHHNFIDSYCTIKVELKSLNDKQILNRKIFCSAFQEVFKIMIDREEKKSLMGARLVRKVLDACEAAIQLYKDEFSHLKIKDLPNRPRSNQVNIAWLLDMDINDVEFEYHDIEELKNYMVSVDKFAEYLVNSILHYKHMNNAILMRFYEDNYYLLHKTISFGGFKHQIQQKMAELGDIDEKMKNPTTVSYQNRPKLSLKFKKPERII